jgi:predicted GNAT family acetyltransferase
VPRGERVALFTSEPVTTPDTWQIDNEFWLHQMVCSVVSEAPALAVRELDRSDVPDMLALTAATRPGPFLEDTILMGRYIGIRADDGRLAAMAGQRLHPAGFTELSAVCTDPTFRGRGYAAALMTILTADIWSRGRTPMLHVMTDNIARRLYERLGFSVRRMIRFSLVGQR